MKKLIFTGCLLLVFCVCSQSLAQSRLVKKRLDNEVEIKVPADFTVLTQEEVVSRYLSNNLPLAVYSNARQTVDLSVTRLPTRWTVADLLILKDFYKSSIETAYTDVEFLQNDVKIIDGRSVLVYEFLSVLEETDDDRIQKRPPISKYTVVLYGFQNGMQYVINFTAPAVEKATWQETAAQIIQSFKIL